MHLDALGHSEPPQNSCGSCPWHDWPIHSAIMWEWMPCLQNEDGEYCQGFQQPGRIDDHNQDETFLGNIRVINHTENVIFAQLLEVLVMALRIVLFIVTYLFLIEAVHRLFDRSRERGWREGEADTEDTLLGILNSFSDLVSVTGWPVLNYSGPHRGVPGWTAVVLVVTVSLNTIIDHYWCI